MIRLTAEPRSYHQRMGTKMIVKLALAAVAVTTMGGCLPSKVTIDLAPGDGKLEESRVAADAGAGEGAPKVVIIDVEGLISSSPPPGLFASRGNMVDSLVARLEKAESDASVRAVILRINSPGGTVAASETVLREIERFRERTKKPVVASMAEVAASGGYYIALGADAIVAQPTSITGSIGVVMPTFNFSKGMAKIGIESRAITSRPNKDLANPFEPMDEEHYAILKGIVDEYYGEFRGLVEERRTKAIDASKMDVIADGRVFTGRAAHELGLVDALGDVRDAFEVAKKLAGVTSAQLVKYHAEGQHIGSLYALARADEDVPSAGGNAAVNVIDLPLPRELTLEPGFYYLWVAGE